MKTVTKMFDAVTAVSAASGYMPLSYVGDGVTKAFALPKKQPSIEDLGTLVVTKNGVPSTAYTISANGENLVFNVAPANAVAIVITQPIILHPESHSDKKVDVQIVITAGNMLACTIKLQGQLEAGNIAWVDILRVTEVDFSSLVAGGQFVATIDGMASVRIAMVNFNAAAPDTCTLYAWMNA